MIDEETHKGEFEIPAPLPAPDPAKPQQVRDLFGMFATVTTAPSAEPKRAIDQIVFYTDSISSPTTYKIYMWSTNLRVWKSATLS
jgi:hypothetical protein